MAKPPPTAQAAAGDPASAAPSPESDSARALPASGPGAGAAKMAEFKLADPQVIGRSMADIAERSQRIVGDWLERQSRARPAADPLNIGRAFLEMTAKLMQNPTRLVQAQIGFWQDYVTLWQNTTRRMMGIEAEPVIEPDGKDKRFRDEAWQQSEIFDFIKQSYLLSARYVHDVVGHVEGLEPKTAQKVDFYARQFVDAMSPSNFVMTNPEVLRRTAACGGENLIRGLNNLLTDLERGRGKLSIRMTDTDAFQLGENIALSPGKIVFQNEVMQLIQYAPATAQVLKRPLLILPPWINKYYILDLRPRNSFVRFAVSQGHSVFMVSWVNPDAALSALGFEDYMHKGVFAALDAIEAATGETQVNAIGYCLGGTLLGVTLAWMAARRIERIASATFFVSLLDFEDAGELGVFIDEEQLQALEARMAEHGYLDGSEMAATFNMLRANDLIWSFVVNNYLLGNDPFPFDLLYWNSDATRMPARMHSFYLRHMYQQNLLARPGGLVLDGVALDLGAIRVPAYFLSTREDHIAPWRSTYRGARLLGGETRFVLAASGHIAGVVNPPEGGKYNHWINEALPEAPGDWLDGATELAGSWWPDWHRWVLAKAPSLVAARLPGAGQLTALEDAPGSYVRVKSGP
jgi:polyhydroxyalkanoate synthase